jgi:hypothetical protein
MSGVLIDLLNGWNFNVRWAADDGGHCVRLFQFKHAVNGVRIFSETVSLATFQTLHDTAEENTLSAGALSYAASIGAA